mgnify:CR=1 FL=1
MSDTSEMQHTSARVAEDQTAPAEPFVPPVQPVFLPDPVAHMRQCARVAHEYADRQALQAGRHRQQAQVHTTLAEQFTRAAASAREIAVSWERLAEQEEARQRWREQPSAWGQVEQPNPADPAHQQGGAA